MSTRTTTTFKPHANYSPRTEFCRYRGNGIYVPLVPVDELPLPPGIEIEGLPPNMCMPDIRSMTIIGDSKSRAEVRRVFRVDDGAEVVLMGRSAGFQAPDADVRQLQLEQRKRGVEKEEWARLGLRRAEEASSSRNGLYDRTTNAYPGNSISTGMTERRGNRPERNTLADTIAALHPTAAARIGYKLLPPSGIEPDQSAKEYCTHWIRYGTCGYMQQGCRYKHEMPETREKLVEVAGLREWPEWWREKGAVRLCKKQEGGVEKERELAWMKKRMAAERIDEKRREIKRKVGVEVVEEEEPEAPKFLTAMRMMKAREQDFMAKANDTPTAKTALRASVDAKRMPAQRVRSPLLDAEDEEEEDEEDNENDLIDLSPLTPMQASAPSTATANNTPSTSESTGDEASFENVSSDEECHPSLALRRGRVLQPLYASKNAPPFLVDELDMARTLTPRRHGTPLKSALKRNGGGAPPPTPAPSASSSSSGDQNGQLLDATDAFTADAADLRRPILDEELSLRDYLAVTTPLAARSMTEPGSSATTAGAPDAGSVRVRVPIKKPKVSKGLKGVNFRQVYVPRPQSKSGSPTAKDVEAVARAAPVPVRKTVHPIMSLPDDEVADGASPSMETSQQMQSTQGQKKHIGISDVAQRMVQRDLDAAEKAKQAAVAKKAQAAKKVGPEEAGATSPPNRTVAKGLMASKYAMLPTEEAPQEVMTKAGMEQKEVAVAAAKALGAPMGMGTVNSANASSASVAGAPVRKKGDMMRARAAKGSLRKGKGG